MYVYICVYIYIFIYIYIYTYMYINGRNERAMPSDGEAHREVGGWGRDPKKCTGRDWGMGSSTI